MDLRLFVNVSEFLNKKRKTEKPAAKNINPLFKQKTDMGHVVLECAKSQMSKSFPLNIHGLNKLVVNSCR